MEVDIEKWYSAYGPMVYRRCRHLLGDEEEALDAMQEVFVKLVRYAHRLDARGPSSLLYTMASNHCLNVLAGKKRMPLQGAEGFFENLAGKDREVDAVVARDLVERIFALHDDTTRLIAWLHYIDGLTLEETAAEVAMSVSGVRKRLRKLSESGKILAEVAP